jgi:hypothetical protein
MSDKTMKTEHKKITDYNKMPYVNEIVVMY